MIKFLLEAGVSYYIPGHLNRVSWVFHLPVPISCIAVWQVSFSFFIIHDQIFSLLDAALQMHCPENLKPIFLEMKLCGLIPNFYIHVSVSDLYIPTIGQKTPSIKIGGPSVGIHIWLIDTGYRSWERGHADSFMRIFVSNFWYSVGYHIPSFLCISPGLPEFSIYK